MPEAVAPVADQSATILARRPGSVKVLISRTREAGRNSAAAAPCKARHVEGLGAVSVGERSGEQQQRREGEHVAVNGPGQRGHGQVKVVRDAGACHIDHRGVECGEEETQGYGEERNRAR